MARYAEWNKFIGNLKTDKYGETTVNEVGIAFEKATADVVPKSEVDKIICKLECLLCHATGGRLSKHTYDLGTMETVVTDCINETYNDGFGEGYKECAREIFEAIERGIIACREDEYSKESGYVVRQRYNANMLIKGIAELKKKYTEGEQRND